MAPNTSSDASTTPVANSRLFKINRRNFSGHYDIESMDGTHLFYVDMWSFGSGKPDLTLHRGPDNKSPIAAVSHMPSLSSSYKIGVGDPSQPDSMLWEELAKEHLTTSGWRWTSYVTSGERDSLSRLNLMWKRTRQATVSGMKMHAMSSRNYKLQDTDTGEMLAVFTSDRNYRSCGVLQMDVSYGQSFDLMMLTTCLTLYEEARREARREAS